MPKRRSNTIANTTEGLIGGSGSNLSEGIIEDLVNAVNGRLDNIVTVQGLSRTRNRIEDINIVSLGNNRYEVSSTEGGTYIVDMNENSCECGQYVYRNECCRHLIAVREALGEVAEVDTINNVEATRRARDIRDEINRNIRGEEQDDNHFYTDNEVDFYNDFAEINDDSIEYEYENVLNGNNSTFGVELEFVGGHVHINMEKLDTARQRWRRFFKTIEVYEDCIYRAAGGDLGRVRSNARHYATPFSPRADESKYIRFNMDNNEDVKRMAAEISEGNRYYGINLTNIARDRAPTVEFRHFNGSLNEKQIQANIKMAAGIINAAEKARFRDTEDEIFKKRENILKNTSRLGGTQTKKKMMEFLDIAFPRKNDKKAILNVFKKTDLSNFTSDDFLYDLIILSLLGNNNK
ncbi:amidoligase family protein [Clostridium perfringens]|uniref:amidoligase family protein n=2 Tax=Clostridium perfringens TaxID=1502 RepID=UPI0028CCACFF|nr:amidoligase family protein [Clostridium perfringens]MDT7927764.1 amidoligase family protein [Clostridium perfringens]